MNRAESNLVCDHTSENEELKRSVQSHLNKAYNNNTVQIKAMQQNSTIIAQMMLLNDQSHNRSKLWL